MFSVAKEPLNREEIHEEVEDDDEGAVFRARGTLLFVSALYGTNFGCVKILGESLNPAFAASVRFFMAAVIFLPFLLDRKVG